LFSIEIRTPDALKKLRETLKEVNSLQARIGVISEAIHPNSNLEMWQLAAIHLYGMPSRGIPKRDFLFQPVQAQKNNILKLIKAQMQKLIDKEITPEEMFERIAVYIQGISQASFRKNNWLPNSAYTIRKKGSSTPLIDTGVLRQSISYIVENKNAS
jgi:phage gpG-like protein